MNEKKDGTGYERKWRAEIEALHEKDIFASKTGDFDTMITLVTDDAVLLPPGLPAISGKASIWKFMQEQKGQFPEIEILEYEHNFKEIKIMDGWAYEWAVYKNAARPRSGGDIVRQKGKLFRVLMRDMDGKWKIIRSIWNVDP